MCSDPYPLPATLGGSSLSPRLSYLAGHRGLKRRKLGDGFSAPDGCSEDYAVNTVSSSGSVRHISGPYPAPSSFSRDQYHRQVRHTALPQDKTNKGMLHARSSDIRSMDMPSPSATIFRHPPRHTPTGFVNVSRNDGMRHRREFSPEYQGNWSSDRLVRAPMDRPVQTAGPTLSSNRPGLPGLSSLLHAPRQPRQHETSGRVDVSLTNHYHQQYQSQHRSTVVKREVGWPQSVRGNSALSPGSPAVTPVLSSMYEWSTVDPRHPHNRHTREDVGRHEDEDSAVVISDDADAKDSSNRYSLRHAGRGPRGPSPQSSPSSVQSDEDNQPEDVATSNANQSGHNKNSRYLREMDRRAILARLANGEKQATLAKEYQVSRAAICNLNKHRDEVMSRTDENPLAKHPKKRKARMLAASKDDESAEAHSTDPATGSSLTLNGGPTSGIVTVHEVKSRAVQLLLTTLRHPSTSLQEFRRCSERMIRLVMEEALAVVPAKPVEVFLNDVVKVDGVGISHPPCAISLEPQYCPMMDMFHLIEPEQPTGYARIDNAASPTSPVSDTSSEASSVPGTPSANVSVGLLDAHLPTTLAFHNVFLLDVVAASGEVICATLQQLKTRGAVESMLHVVALFVSSEVVAMVQCKFPGVKIITAQIDSSINKKTQRGSNVDGILLRLEQVYNAQHLRV